MCEFDIHRCSADTGGHMSADTVDIDSMTKQGLHQFRPTAALMSFRSIGQSSLPDINLPRCTLGTSGEPALGRFYCGAIRGDVAPQSEGVYRIARKRHLRSRLWAHVPAMSTPSTSDMNRTETVLWANSVGVRTLGRQAEVCPMLATSDRRHPCVCLRVRSGGHLQSKYRTGGLWRAVVVKSGGQLRRSAHSAADNSAAVNSAAVNSAAVNFGGQLGGDAGSVLDARRRRTGELRS